MITFKENSKSENESFTSGVSILSAGNGLLGFSTRTCNTSMFFIHLRRDRISVVSQIVKSNMDRLTAYPPR